MTALAITFHAFLPQDHTMMVQCRMGLSCLLIVLTPFKKTCTSSHAQDHACAQILSSTNDHGMHAEAIRV
jgi:hypothetical protein